MKSNRIRSAVFCFTVGLLLVANMAAGGTLFYDDFSDGSARDGMPVSWKSGVGTFSVEGESLIVSGTAGQSVPWIYVPDVSVSDVSIRARLRLIEGQFIGIVGRRRPHGTQRNYYSYVSRDSDGQFNAGIGIGGNNPTDLVDAVVPFDVMEEDVILQLDNFGGALSFWAWPANESMPPDPLGRTFDDTLDEGVVYVWVGASNSETSSRGEFRYVHVADEHIFDRGLLPGDANQDLEFNQLDLVQVLQAGKYLTAAVATWGEGDWDGAPGGSPGTPPDGDGVFDHLDIIAALNHNAYLTGPYAEPDGEPLFAIPEPKSLTLLAVGLLALAARRSGRDGPFIPQ